MAVRKGAFAIEKRDCVDAAEDGKRIAQIDCLFGQLRVAWVWRADGERFRLDGSG